MTASIQPTTSTLQNCLKITDVDGLEKIYYTDDLSAFFEFKTPNLAKEAAKKISSFGYLLDLLRCDYCPKSANANCVSGYSAKTMGTIDTPIKNPEELIRHIGTFMTEKSAWKDVPVVQITSDQLKLNWL